MNNRTVNQVKWGSILAYIQMALNIVIGLIYTPLMIRLLGRSEYGLYNTVSSTISSLTILSLGFNSSYIRYYSKYKENDSDEEIARLNGLYIIVFFSIGIIALACGLFLTNHLDIVFSDGLTNEEYTTAKMLMLLLTFNLAVSFPMSVFVNIISAREKFIFLKLAGMIRTVIGPLIIIPLLYMGIGSIGIVGVTVCLSLFVDILYSWYVLSYLKINFKFQNIQISLFREILIFSAFIALNMIVDQINNNVDKILLGRFRGTGEVAIYSVGASLSGYFTTFSTSISGVFIPRIHGIVNKFRNNSTELKNNITNLFIRVGRIQFLILALIASGIVFFGKYFITNIWAGKGYDDSYYVALLLIVPAIIPLIENIGIEVQRALNLHQFRSIAYSIMALVNLIISIYLCKLFGAIGSAFGTTIAVCLAHGLIMNIFYHRKCYIDIIKFWRNIGSIAKGLIIPFIFGCLLLKFISINSITQFVFLIFAYTIVYCISMWLFGINDYEKQLIKRPLSKLFMQKNNE